MDTDELRKSLSDIPDNSHELIALLRALLPPRCKQPGESLEEHMFYSGMCSLASALYEAMELQEEMIREDNLVRAGERSSDFFKRYGTTRVTISS